jgi:hypothetical protein
MAQLTGRLIRRPGAAYSYLPVTRSDADVSALSLAMEVGDGDGDLRENHRREVTATDQVRCRRRQVWRILTSTPPQLEAPSPALSAIRARTVLALLVVSLIAVVVLPAFVLPDWTAEEKRIFSIR